MSPFEGISSFWVEHSGDVKLVEVCLRESKGKGFHFPLVSARGDAIWPYTFMWAARIYLKDEE